MTRKLEWQYITHMFKYFDLRLLYKMISVYFWILIYFEGLHKWRPRRWVNKNKNKMVFRIFILIWNPSQLPTNKKNHYLKNTDLDDSKIV